MDESIRKEPIQLPDKEAAQVDGGAVGPDIPIPPMYKPIKYCEQCKNSFSLASLPSSRETCPKCGGKLLPYIW